MPQDSFEPPHPPVPFVGRGKDLEWLEKHMNPKTNPRFESYFSITGESGIGKTALVAEFLKRHAERPSPVGIDCSALEFSRPDFGSMFRRREVDLELRRSRRRGITVVLDGMDHTSARRSTELFYGVINSKVVGQVIITSRERPELRIFDENVRQLSRLQQAEIDRLIREKVSLSDLDENEAMRLLSVINGSPAAAQIMAGMAGALSSEQLRRVLSGELYDVRSAKPGISNVKIARVVKPLLVADNERILKNLKKRPEEILKLSPRQFEEVVADLLQAMGYEVDLTKQTRDGGADILAKKKTEIGQVLCLVDAKRYKETHKIGVEKVRTLMGTLADYNATSAMLATTSAYSKEARAMEEKHKFKLSLKDYADVVGWIHGYGE